MCADAITFPDVSSLSAATLIDDLYTSGAISQQERIVLLETARGDSARDRAANNARCLAAPSVINPKPTKRNYNMDPKTIIASIERNRHVMTAQVEKLGECSPKLVLPTFSGTEMPANVAALLNASVLGHLQGAADALHAIAETEASIRRTADVTQPATGSTRHSPETIDVEAIVIDSKERK